MNISDLQELLPAIRDYLPDAIIAGGAPRDAYFGKPIKDIDVMTGCDVTRKTLERLAISVGGRFDVIEPTDPSGCEEFEYEIHFDDGRPRLNIIDLNPFEIKDPVDNLHDFDFALSQIAVTPHGVVMTEEFVYDAARGLCTYTGDRGKAQWRIDSSAKRLQRLKAKYPKRLFVNCESLEALNLTGGA